MRIKSQVLSIIANILSHSLGLQLMVKLARDFIPGYDIYARMGYRPSVPIPSLDATRRIVRDLNDAGFLFEMLEWVAKVDKFGYMGKKYPVAGLPDIIQAIKGSGYLFDEESQSFFENPKVKKTMSWGRLLEGRNYTVTLLKLDIVSNSSLVREHDEKHIDSVYDIFFKTSHGIIEKRNGRIWHSEGDGLIAAFHYTRPAMSAVLAGMEILNKLKVFNITGNTLNRDLDVRIALHSGHILYSEDIPVLLKNELVRELNDIEEKRTPTGTMALSAPIALHIDSILKETMYILKKRGARDLLAYTPEYKR